MFFVHKSTTDFSNVEPLTSRPRGMIKKDPEGRVYWRATEQSVWRSAIYHREIRAELIQAAARLGAYKYPRKHGSALHDETSYLPCHQNYGEDRSHRPDILFQYEKPEGESNNLPSIWIYNEQVVLDWEHHPVLNWPNTPATFSSKLEGWLQEAISRENPMLAAKDFIARMLPGLCGETILCVRRSRFRQKAGCLSWRNHHVGFEATKAYLDSILPGPCKVANSTKGFRDLNSNELSVLVQLTQKKQLKNDRSLVSSRPAFPRMRRFRIKNPDNIGRKQKKSPGKHSISSDTCGSPGNAEQRSSQTDTGPIEHVASLTTFPDSLTKADYRLVKPQTADEAQVIAQALEISRHAFRLMTGLNATLTNQSDSYHMQYFSLQREYEDIMVSRGLHVLQGISNGQLHLPKVEAWLDGFPVSAMPAGESRC